MEKASKTKMDSDGILVKRCQQGDEEAFRILIYKYQQSMMNLVFRLTHDYHASHDLAQEVFIKVFKGIKNFKGNSSFSTWLYRIAINVAINYNRAKQKKDRVFVNRIEDNLESLEKSSGWEENPESVFQSLELFRHMEKALQALSEDHKAIIILRDIEGISYEKIAELFNCPIGTVRSRLARARQALKMKLKPYL